jgi:hypothetical protein
MGSSSLAEMQEKTAYIRPKVIRSFREPGCPLQ